MNAYGKLGAVVTLVAGLSGQACPAPSSRDDGAAALLLLLAGSALSNARPCAGNAASPPAGTLVADTVTSAPAATGFGTTDKACLTNGVRGEGEFAGSVDVFSLTGTGAGAVVILSWAGKKITNGSGIDFVVFENPFKYLATPANVFMEPVIVEVSENDTTHAANQWCGFDPDFAPGGAETAYSLAPAHWVRFAGITPVKYHQDNNPLFAPGIFDSTQAGGDGFDLANLSASNAFGIGCDTTIRNNILANGFVYLRLTAATSRTNPDSGSVFPQDGSAIGGGPDIDGVIGRYLVAR